MLLFRTSAAFICESLDIRTKNLVSDFGKIDLAVAMGITLFPVKIKKRPSKSDAFS
jgi:hypothetical protein